jgi:hypothetical protein
METMAMEIFSKHDGGLIIELVHELLLLAVI